VVTRGERGSIAINENNVVDCESKKNLNIQDLTGAGDLFAAGFLHGYINNLSLKESLELGTDMSSKIIQKIGARLN
jgi:fructokinase